jgi:hypothetical protein
MAFLRFLTKPLGRIAEGLLGINSHKIQAPAFKEPPNPLTSMNKEATSAGLEERRKRAAQKGRASTILGGEQGAPSLATKSLLGG